MSKIFKFSELMRIPEDIDTAPHIEGGLYSISFRFPSSFEFGITEDLEDYEHILNSIRSKIKTLFKLSSSKEMTGVVSDHIYGAHLRSEYSVEIKKIVSNWIDLFNLEVDQVEKNFESIVDLVSIIEIAVRELPPLYVGLAKKQSIKDRLLQHRNGDTDFSKRLKENNIYWNNLGFQYLIVPGEKAHHLRRYEKIIQSVTLPALSRL